MKVCPRFRAANISSGKFRFHFENDGCLGKGCELWNERFGMCCEAVDAYLKGQEDWRAEKELIRAEAKSERDRREL